MFACPRFPDADPSQCLIVLLPGFITGKEKRSTARRIQAVSLRKRDGLGRKIRTKKRKSVTVRGGIHQPVRLMRRTKCGRETGWGKDTSKYIKDIYTINTLGFKTSVCQVVLLQQRCFCSCQELFSSQCERSKELQRKARVRNLHLLGDFLRLTRRIFSKICASRCISMTTGCESSSENQTWVD